MTRFNPNYKGKGYWLKVADQYFIEFNGDIEAVCLQADVPLRTYYSWYCLDPYFREQVDYLKKALHDHDGLCIRQILSDTNMPAKYRMQAYSILHPEPKDGVSDSDQSFSLNIQYNGQPL